MIDPATTALPTVGGRYLREPNGGLALILDEEQPAAPDPIDEQQPKTSSDLVQAATITEK